MILVVGSTGLVGMEICKLLADQNRPFRAMVRKTSDPEKVNALREMGAEIVQGDLKSPPSLRDACFHVEKVISTASCTTSRSEGDNINTVDRCGQLNLIDTAYTEGVKKFIFVSFRENPEVNYPLNQAKREVEHALKTSGMDWCSLQASYFMEVWLSPHLGFDIKKGMVRVYGDGKNKISWISFRDVARYAVEAVDSHNLRKVVHIGGPEALSPREVIKKFETITGRSFKIEYVPEESLKKQRETAGNDLEKTFAGLMLNYAHGDEVDSMPWLRDRRFELNTLDDYARSLTAMA